MLGDHLAMDLLNTEACNNGESVEFWSGAEDVLRWLERYGIVPATKIKSVDRTELLKQARALRAMAHKLIVQRKAGKENDVSGLNDYLNAYLSAPQLARDSAGNLTLSRTARGDTLASLLGPVAEAVAQLLVEGNFDLVKQCEHPDCILWFYDRTKAHKRRWCSMALCGNRYKAAQFRRRMDAV